MQGRDRPEVSLSVGPDLESGPTHLSNLQRTRRSTETFSAPSTPLPATGGPPDTRATMARVRDGHGDDWADIIDMLTMHPEARRKVVRMLGEIEAAERG